MGDDFLIGIDLGGTKIAAAAFDMNGCRLGKIARLPTMASMKPVVTLMNLKRVVKQAQVEAGVTGAPRAIGMGSSGPLDIRNRVLQDRDSLPSLVGFGIGKYCQHEFGAPLYLENDASCFALGEALQGAGRAKEIVLGVTLGTGFGAASQSMARSIREPQAMRGRWPIAESAMWISTMPVRGMRLLSSTASGCRPVRANH